MNWREIPLDQVPAGTMVYSLSSVPIGIVRDYWMMNGNRASIPMRHLDNGNPKDRFAYRRERLYREARNAGPVMIRANQEDRI